MQGSRVRNQLRRRVRGSSLTARHGAWHSGWIRIWTHIRDWLAGIGLEQYAELFESNDIDPQLLTELNEAHLERLGIGSLGHRVRVLKAANRIGPDVPGAGPGKAVPAPPTERRQLTVLFCDLSG